MPTYFLEKDSPEWLLNSDACPSEPSGLRPISASDIFRASSSLLMCSFALPPRTLTHSSYLGDGPLQYHRADNTWQDLAQKLQQPGLVTGNGGLFVQAVSHGVVAPWGDRGIATVG